MPKVSKICFSCVSLSNFDFEAPTYTEYGVKILLALVSHHCKKAAQLKLHQEFALKVPSCPVLKSSNHDNHGWRHTSV